MQILDSTQRVQTHPFAQQLQTTTRSGATAPTKRHCAGQAPANSTPIKTLQHFRCSHRFQHRLDCIVIFSVHGHRAAADHGKELSQLFCRGTVSEHVTRIEFSINTFHLEVSLLQFLLQPTVPHIQMFHSSDASLMAKCSGNICVSMQNNRKKPHPTELLIVLHQFGFFQNFAHAHDFTFTTAERVLSSRPAEAMQSATTNHQISTRC